ncbi:MAG: sulfurtransferase FdhD, partial [Bryobacterales bacterium]|nr:sulfurtransferase FdhD [Bryobacterales bacterium]
MEPSSTLVRNFDIKRIEHGCSERRIDTVAAEEPLQVRLQYWFKDAPTVTALALTMRTPGHDREFAAGYLLTEGIIERREDIHELRSIGTEPSNEIVVELAPTVDVDSWMLSRNGPLNASCGICGKRSIEALSAYARPLRTDG